MAETDTWFTRAQEIAIAHETASRDARAVTMGQENSPVTAEVHAVRNQPAQFEGQGPRRQPTGPSTQDAGTRQACASCGGAHPRADCRLFRSAECRVCHKFGHICTVCRSKSVRRSTDDPPNRTREPEGTANVVSESDYSVLTLSGNGRHSTNGFKNDYILAHLL